MADSSTPTPILSEEIVLASRSLHQVADPTDRGEAALLDYSIALADSHEALRQRVTALEDAQTIAEGRYRALDREHEALRDALRTAEAEREQVLTAFDTRLAYESAPLHHRAERAEAEVVRLRAALTGASALHRPAESKREEVEYCAEDGFTWPCRTARALALVGETTPEPARAQPIEDQLLAPQRRWKADRCPTCGSTDRLLTGRECQRHVELGESPDAWHGEETPE